MAQRTYTYVLKDLDTGLYKIGKSINPRARFRQLCRPGKVVPVHVFQEDIEGELHGRYNAQRLKTHPNPEYKDGHTEWFKYGGKLKPFIDELEVQEIAFYSPHNLYDQLHKEGNLFIPAKIVSNKVTEPDYYQYIIGRKILNMLGYIFYNGMGYDSNHEGIAMSGPKLFITNTILTEVLNNYTVAIVSTRFQTTLSRFKNLYGKKVFVRKIDSLPQGDPIYMVIAEV